jgi:RNA polymerase primary sigma factor
MRQLKITPSITNRDSQSLDKYLTDIGKTSLITADQEAELARRIREGDQMALELLTKANLRFVVSVSKQFQNQGLTLGDLISEGNLGLIKAAKRFDESRGFKFISYAVWWIRQSIMQAIAEKYRIVRLPQNQVSLIKRLNKTFARLEQEFGRNPSVEELAEAMEITSEIIADIVSKSASCLSMDAPFGQDGENSLKDVISGMEPDTDSLLMSESLTSMLGTSLSVLPLREKEILILFFGINKSFPLSLDEIGEKYGMTGERVRQLKDKALAHMRGHKTSFQLKAYLT